MDPLSLTASLIAVIGLAQTVTELVDKTVAWLKESEAEFCLLRNEIADLQIVLVNTNAILYQNSGSHDPHKPVDFEHPALSRAIKASEAQLLDLQRILNVTLLDGFDRGGRAKLVKRRWVNHRHHVRLLIENLRRSKTDMSLMLQAENLHRTMQMDVTIRDFSQELAMIKSDILTPQQAALEQLVHHLSKSPLAEPSESPLHTTNAPPPSTQDTPVDADEYGVTAWRHKRVEIQAACSSLTCAPWCSCVCHKKNKIRSPGFLGSILGSLFLGYSGVPVLTPPCDERSCRARKRTSIFVKYQFPSWFLARTFSWQLSLDATLGPELILRMPRSIPFVSETYQACVNGDATKVQALMHMGMASPYDVDPDGLSLLTMAVQYEHLDLCRFLVSKGASPYQEDQTGLSAHHYAWDMILLRPAANAKANRILEEIFPQDDDHKDERQFSMVHKSVLRLVGTPLDTVLSLSSKEIDTVDNVGRTPLYWAASRGDAQAVRLLLAKGADPLIKGGSTAFQQSSSLHAAARGGDVDVVKLLIAAGADLAEPGFQGWTPLMLAAGRTDKPDCVDALIDSGAEVDQRHYQGQSAFMNAVMNGKLDNAERLLQRGADINLMDDTNYTSLAGCVFWSMHESIEFLLDRGADTTSVTTDGETLLHLAAIYGDLEVIRIFQHRIPQEINPDIVSDAGKTALQHAEERLGVDEEWRCEFKKLEDLVRRARRPPLRQDSRDSGVDLSYDEALARIRSIEDARKAKPIGDCPLVHEEPDEGIGDSDNECSAARGHDDGDCPGIDGNDGDDYDHDHDHDHDDDDEGYDDDADIDLFQDALEFLF